MVIGDPGCLLETPLNKTLYIEARTRVAKTVPSRSKIVLIICKIVVDTGIIYRLVFVPRRHETERG